MAMPATPLHTSLVLGTQRPVASNVSSSTVTVAAAAARRSRHAHTAKINIFRWERREGSEGRKQGGVFTVCVCDHVRWDQLAGVPRRLVSDSNVGPNRWAQTIGCIQTHDTHTARDHI